MKYNFNRLAKVIQGDDITIHYTTGDNGFEIISFCPSCLEKYLEKKKGDTQWQRVAIPPTTSSSIPPLRTIS